MELTPRQRLAAACAALVLALSVAACDRRGGDEDAAAASPAAEPTTTVSIVAPEVAASAGCAVGVDPSLHDIDGSLTFDGEQRTYLLHLPPAYDGSTPLPLVLNLHGFGSNARNQAAYSRLPQKGDAEGFIVVTPNGAGTPQAWNNIMLPSGADDVGFIAALLDELEAHYCIATDAVFAAGISNGAAFALRLACEMPDRFAAFGVVAALFYPGRCAPAEPVAIIAFHGTDDACVPFNGGVTACGITGLPVPSVNDGAQRWAEHNSCSTSPSFRRLSEHIRTIAYSECDDEVAVVVFVVEGGGHTWPGSIDVPRLGAVTNEIDATEQMWSLFLAQSALR